eukprot:comp17151_c0_seq1/m.15966 comp17151_c0_seq1/g.15966  ORF comp17151_c0_seq1/g.15966 comp17151_c0_seq1/m.15966 type:complete len:323 (+) comp17151_c0_seq1:1239-2207(+)
MGNQTGTNKLTNHAREVGGNGIHACLEVVVQLRAVLTNGDHLLAQVDNVGHILLAHVATHADLGSLLNVINHFLWQNIRQIRVLDVGACLHLAHDLGVCKVVGHQLRHFGEVPAVPFTHAHAICVQLLVKIIQKRNCLDDHGVHLVRGELQLVAGERVGETKSHGMEVTLGGTSDKRLHLIPDAPHKLCNIAASNTVDARLLLDHTTQLGVQNSKIISQFLLYDVLVQELLEPLVQLALGDGCSSRKSLGSVLELLESLQLHNFRRLIRGLEGIPDVLWFLQGPLVQDLEQGKPCSCLKKHQHSLRLLWIAGRFDRHTSQKS